MKNAYPIIMTEGKKFIVVYIPDFNINTQGGSISEAIEMARDAIGITGVDMEDDGESIPKASDLRKIQKNADKNTIVSLVDVDFDDYRRKNNTRSVRKNCTIPYWLNFEAEKAGINFSAILQTALKNELNIANK